MAVLGLAAIGFWSAPLTAQEARLVLDFDPSAIPVGSGLDGSVRVGDGLLFSRSKADGVNELWFTDGSAEGTRLLFANQNGDVEALRGVPLADGTALIVFGGLNDQGLGVELFRTDGTTDGTNLVADLCPGPCDGFTVVNGGRHDFQTRGNKVYFLGRSAPAQPRLFSYDLVNGIETVTSAPAIGFALVDAPPPGTGGPPGGNSEGPGGGPSGGPPLDPDGPGGGNGDTQPAILLISQASGATPARLSLFREQGAITEDLQNLDRPKVLSMMPFGNAALVVLALGDSEPELFRGDENGLQNLLSDVGAKGVVPVLMHSFFGDESSSNAAFIHRPTLGGCEIRQIESIAGGSTKVAQFSVPECWREATLLGNRLVFIEPTGSGGGKVYASNGSGTSTTVLAPNAAANKPGRLTVLGNQVAWLDELDGEGALLISNGSLLSGPLRTFDAVDVGRAVARPMGVLNGELFFAADGGGTGLELWKSDGTLGGTSLVENLTPDVASSSPVRFTDTSRGLTFSIGFDVEDSRLYLLESDAPGTQVEPPLVGSDIAVLGSIGSKAIVASSISGQSLATVSSLDLVTEEQLVLFQGAIADFESLEGRGLVVQLQRQVASGSVSDGIWFTDGSVEGTVKLHDGAADSVAPLAPSGIAVFSLVQGRREIFFETLQGADGPGQPAQHQIWATRGAAETTRLVHSGPAEPPRRLLGVTTEQAFLATFENLQNDVEAGTSTVSSVDVATGEAVSLPEDSNTLTLSTGETISRSLGFRGRLMLSVDGVDGGSDSSLLITDGTDDGTVELGRFASIGPLTVGRALVFFPAATEGNGVELWATDGTQEGTRMISDSTSGPAGSNPQLLTMADGVVTFQQEVPGEGTELWLTDGSLDFFQMVEIEPGPSGSRPAEMTVSGEDLFFAAERSDVGREIFAVERADLRRPCVPSETTLCLGDGRFAVEAEWFDRVSGDRSVAGALPLREDTGTFWFFDQENVELVVKVLDARSFTDHWWVFFGGLSDVNYWLTVTDTWSGESQTYSNRQGDNCGGKDTAAFRARPLLDDLVPVDAEQDVDASGFSMRAPQSADSQGFDLAGAERIEAECGDTVLCLQDGRFSMSVTFQVKDEPERGTGIAVPGNDETGYFWFFDEENIELAIKVLDGRPITGTWWLFYGALSDVEYAITVQDNETGVVRVFENPQGSICGDSDTRTFVNQLP